MSELNGYSRFPDPHHTTAEGIVCVGGDLSISTLLEAYSKGIFPWPQKGYPILWYCPPERGILEFSDFHISKSLKKAIRQSQFSFTFDKAFEEVISKCSLAPRPDQTGTWILPEMVEAYVLFQKLGFVHSLECWQGEQLVGGLYGVWVGGVFMGESMFYKVDNASKACLVALVEFLQEQGHKWMDIQMVTPLLEQMGGKYISRDLFLRRLKEAQTQHPYESIVTFTFP